MLHLPVLVLAVISVVSFVGWRYEHQVALRLRRERDDEMRRAADQHRRARTAEDALQRLQATCGPRPGEQAS
jgi:hypothetical protein